MTMMDESATEFLESVISYEAFINQKYDNDTAKLEAYHKLVRGLVTGDWQSGSEYNEFLAWLRVNSPDHGLKYALSCDDDDLAPH